MSEGKKVTFFMLVTERDCIIADYAISSYQKIYQQQREFGYQDFSLFVYLNCLSEKSKSAYLDRWSNYPYTVLFDNASKSIGKPYPGEAILSPEGIPRSRDDYAESYDELWTTELRNFDTPFIATVDADFEILHPDYYFDLMDRLKKNPQFIGASSSHSEASFLFDTYSNRNIWLQERNHTWFCIYRKEAFTLSHVSHFYFEEKNERGEIVAYDSAAYFQHDLRVNKGFSFIYSAPEYSRSFIHYGASSKNKTLNADNIGEYRRRFLLVSIGIFHGKIINPVMAFVNNLARKLARKRYHQYLNRFTAERSTYIFQEDEKEQPVSGSINN